MRVVDEAAAEPALDAELEVVFLEFRPPLAVAVTDEAVTHPNELVRKVRRVEILYGVGDVIPDGALGREVEGTTEGA